LTETRLVEQDMAAGAVVRTDLVEHLVLVAKVVWEQALERQAG
jgi:hypothetical protein